LVNLKNYIGTNEELGKCDTIIALSFGINPDNKPGISNNELAEWVDILQQYYHRPLILQWEIAEAERLSESLPAKVIRKHRTEGRYLDTYEVLSQAKEFCDEKNWNKIILVTHQDQLRRAIRTAGKLGFTVKIPPQTWDIDYNPNSIQPWTRNKWRFKLREILANLIYFLKDYI